MLLGFSNKNRSEMTWQILAHIWQVDLQLVQLPP